MASAFAHALVAYTSTKLNSSSTYATYSWRILFVAVILSIIPDIDSIGFFLGIPYGDVFGHRGISHSIFLAFICSLFLVFALFSKIHIKQKTVLIIFFTLVMSSHGLLDAMTTGGLGVAFFAPFDNSRYFLPWRPILVSPIGVKSFFSDWGLRVILSELIWIGIPCSVILVLRLFFNFRRKRN